MKTPTTEIPAIIDEAKAAGCENTDQIHGYLAAEVSRLRDLVSERESRLANIKFLLEPIYGSTNYAPIGGTLDRVLNICDRGESGPHYVLVG